MNPADQERQPEPTGDEQEPDFRFTLANERTFLAWIRTALALIAGGVAVAQLVPAFEIPGTRRWQSGAGNEYKLPRRDADLSPTRLPVLLGRALLAITSVLPALLVLRLGRGRGRRIRAIRLIAGKKIVSNARTEVLLIGWLRDGHRPPHD
jgi:putative membrane protein